MNKVHAAHMPGAIIQSDDRPAVVIDRIRQRVRNTRANNDLTGLGKLLTQVMEDVADDIYDIIESYYCFES